MASEQYKTILTNNVTKTYRKAEQSTQLNMEREGIGKKMECYAERPAFISFKDHKENFKHNTKCRLTNSSKKEMGISK